MDVEIIVLLNAEMIAVRYLALTRRKQEETAKAIRWQVNDGEPASGTDTQAPQKKGWKDGKTSSQVEESRKRPLSAIAIALARPRGCRNRAMEKDRQA